MIRAVEARDVFRVFSTAEGDAAALQGLDLTVDEREVVAVLGPSGSGKSTLLRLLAALDTPSAGTVRVLGLEVGRLPAARRYAFRTRSVGYADQRYSRSLEANLSARDLVSLPLALRGVPRGPRRDRADELLERVGLADRRHARPGELSGGEQQRIAVCAAVAHRPRLLLADEPTGELDAASATAVFDLIGRLARDEGCTAVVVSHDPAAAGIADRAVRIRDGRVAEEAVRTAPGGREAIVVARGGWLRLPEDLLARAGIGARAAAALGDGGVVVTPLGDAVAEAGAEAPPGARRAQGGALVAELRGVSKAFGRGRSQRTVLHSLDTAFHAGTFYAVTGPSGSGKTTLLELLAGLVDATEGEVVVDGTSLRGLDRAGRARLRAERIGFVPQAPALAPFLSARENVELALALRGVEAKAATEDALVALDAVGLAERVEQRVSRLSSGERGRVAVARALAARPALLLADEPTSRLDQANALAVATLLARLARETGAAVVCATHDPLVLDQADARLALA